MVRMIIAGSRKFTDYEKLEKDTINLIFRIGRKYPNLNLYSVNENDNTFKINKDSIEIISGMAKGADSLAVEFAKKWNLTLKKFPANWNDFTEMRCHIKVGKNGERYNSYAGNNRNRRMADYAIKDNSFAVLALFWDGKSRGSRNMKFEAKRHGMKIFETIVQFN